MSVSEQYPGVRKLALNIVDYASPVIESKQVSIEDDKF